MNTSKEDRALMVMERSMANLEYIENNKTDNGPYEVTQLVNTFLGALAHPWEELKSEFKKQAIQDAEKAGWPRVTKELPTDTDPKNLGDLIRLMRNAMAHGGITLLPEGDCEIERIHLVNVDPRCGHRTWGTELTRDDARAFLDKFVAEAKALKQRKSNRK